jgi:serine/threonine-protein kinase
MEALGPGTVVAGRYRLEAEIARGGMGVVWAARHTQLGQRLALKLMRSDRRDEARTRRLLREARAVAVLESEHVCRVHDADVLPDGTAFIAMELLEGSALDELLNERGALPVEEAVDLVLQACAGLAVAHASGIVHRDIKPSNLFLTTRPEGTALLKVLDFGVAKLAPEPVPGTEPSLTDTGCTLGTPGYMSPEQLRSSKDVDARADVWSLGLVLHKILTGASAFPARSPGEYYAAILTEAPRSLAAARPEIPHALDEVVARCLEKDPGDRPEDVAELARALAPFAPGSALLVTRIEKLIAPAGAAARPQLARRTAAAASTVTARGGGDGDTVVDATRETDAAPSAGPKGRTRLIARVAGTLAAVVLLGLALDREAPPPRLAPALAVPELVAPAESSLAPSTAPPVEPAALPSAAIGPPRRGRAGGADASARPTPSESPAAPTRTPRHGEASAATPSAPEPAPPAKGLWESKL